LDGVNGEDDGKYDESTNIDESSNCLEGVNGCDSVKSSVEAKIDETVNNDE
jgi:hypothetical protein